MSVYPQIAELPKRTFGGFRLWVCVGELGGAQTTAHMCSAVRNPSKVQATTQTARAPSCLPVFACFGDDAWLRPEALMDLMVIWYKVAAFRPVTVPGELATVVSMIVSPSSAVSK